MTMLYPNTLDVYGFCPIEAEAECGDWVTDANTGIMAKVRYQGDVKGVYSGGVFWEIKERREANNASDL